MTITKGQQIGRYQIISPIGRGGMAEVYRAKHIDLDIDVAIKLIRVDQFPPSILKNVIKRFQNEAKRMAQLSHPNIVPVTDYGNFQGIPFLVMKYLPGGTLKQFLGKPMPFAEAASLILPIADALAYAHSKSIIHRDVKPANILISEDDRPMLSDFGVAKIMENEDTLFLTASGASIGTPAYMAPEQAMGKHIDHKVDMYSLAIIYYELITGRSPFIADTPMELVVKKSTQPLPPPTQFVRSLPKEVSIFLEKALDKDPTGRFENMKYFSLTLEKLAAAAKPKAKTITPRTHQVVHAVPQEKKSHKQQTTRTEKKEPLTAKWLIGALGIVGVSLAVFAGIKLFGGAGESLPIKALVNTSPEEKAVMGETPSPDPSITPQITTTPAIDPHMITKDNFDNIEVVFSIPNSNQSAISNDGKYLITSNYYYQSDVFRLSNLERKNLVYEKIIDTTDIRKIEISPLNSSILIYTHKWGSDWSQSYGLEVIDLLTGEKSAFQDPTKKLNSISFSEDEKVVAELYDTKLIRIIDGVTNSIIGEHPMEICRAWVENYHVTEIYLSEDGETVFFYDGCSIQVWDILPWKKVDQFEVVFFQLARSNSNEYLIFNMKSDNQQHIYDLKKREYKCALEDAYFGESPSFSLNQSGLISFFGNYFWNGSKIISDTNFYIYDSENCTKTKIIESGYKNSQGLGGMQFSKDGTLIFSVPNHFNNLNIIDYSSGLTLRQLVQENAYPNSIMVTQDGKFIIAGYSDNVTRVWGIPEP